MAIDVSRIFAESLISLSKEKPLSKITVVDIIKRSGAGRQTFYNHFKDKNDLIYFVFARTLTDEDELLEKAGLFTYLTKTYTEAQENAPFFRQACMMDGQNCLSEAIVSQTYRFYKEIIIAEYGKEAITSEIEKALVFNAHGSGTLYIQWAKEGMPGEAREQVWYALQCMPSCLKRYMPLDKEQRERTAA